MTGYKPKYNARVHAREYITEMYNNAKMYIEHGATAATQAASQAPHTMMAWPAAGGGGGGGDGRRRGGAVDNNAKMYI